MLDKGEDGVPGEMATNCKSSRNTSSVQELEKSWYLGCKNPQNDINSGDDPLKTPTWCALTQTPPQRGKPEMVEKASRLGADILE